MTNLYQSSYTISYKTGYIYRTTIQGHEIIRVQVDGHAYLLQIKSIHAAKIMISRHTAKLTNKEFLK
jgi:hypothetical protein